MRKIIKTIKTVFPYLIFITLFSIPFQIRKVLIPVFENGYFHETLSISFYFTDVLVILCVIMGAILFWEEIKQIVGAENFQPLLQPMFWFGLLVLWQIATLFRAENVGVGAFRIAKIVEMALFGIVLWFSFRNIRDRKSHLPLPPCRRQSLWRRTAPPLGGEFSLLFVLMLSGTLQAVWGILQFCWQKSFGLTFLKESVLSPSISGVAKVIIGGQKYIRAYGGLPHPNVLAGFLLVSILCTIILIFCRGRKFSAPTKDSLPPLPPPQAGGELKLTLVCSSDYTKVTLVLIQLIGFALAASFSAMLGLVLGIGLIYICICRGRKFSAPTKDSLPPLPPPQAGGELKLTLVCSSDYTKVTLVLIISGAILLGGMFILRKGDLFKKNSSSVSERARQYEDVRNIISQDRNWIWGVGTGNYIERLKEITPPPAPVSPAKPLATHGSSGRRGMPWQKQPVHNIFALILAENGIVGLILFCAFFVLLAIKFPLVIVLLPIMLFDHYLYTMQQGMLIVILLAVISCAMQSLKTE